MMKFILMYQQIEGQTLILLANASDRMVIGRVAQGTAGFGLEATEAVVRHFLDDAAALAWLKVQACELAGREDVDFLIENREDRKVTAPNRHGRLVS